MEVFKESSVQKEKFRITANKLLNKCFIIKKKKETRDDYTFILQHKNLFDEYFDLLGYTVDINENQEVIALRNVEGTGRLRLKKIESVILLILRLLYIEKRKELSLNDEVIVLSEEVHAKYNMLKINTKPNLEKSVFRETIRLFKRYNIVSNIDTDVALSDTRIKIYPSILFAVPADNLEQVAESITDKLNKYLNGGEPSEDEEIN